MGSRSSIVGLELFLSTYSDHRVIIMYKVALSFESIFPLTP